MSAVPWYASLRVRLAAALAVTSFLIAALLGAWIAHVALQDAREQMREQAASTLRAGTATYVMTGQVAPTVQVGEEGLPADLIREAAAGDDVVTYAGETSTWAAWHTDEEAILSVRLPNGPATARWQELARSILALSLGSAVLSSAVGWFVAGRLTRRLRTAADYARALRTHESLSTVIAPRGGDDEVAVLTGVIDDTAHELFARIDQERELTADVAHELRTPLTALVSATDLLDDSEDSQRVRQLVARTQRLVDDMLILAREEASDPAEPERVRVEELAARAADRCPVDVQIHVLLGTETPSGAGPEAWCAGELIVSALESLLVNARRHGAVPLEILVDGLTLRVHDHGSGYPEELLAAGPRRFHPLGPTGGTGLGLVIAERRVARAGGELTLRNGDDGGAEAVIRLPRG
ncbi:HAMP domain-containing protein [Brachybacterium alimentarium]|uniref:sensor histidine kinase n=1 Tax=Brachybacterium alimentarium TaxID=47845 RepID=UPI000DF2D1DA|nr:ATP-binding protein [Brachybacterium alimentarium]RCS93542.1 HAMP domain-containing protein [Brachybacterium alimentarium]